ncbi:MAG: hypothetical protein K8S98_09625 [Planctomycetes bacterium]|nr:hypothetical protein [Planctomycetota bacterium]
MDHRLGTCTDCRARYQIPASFPHSRAKCRSCGGVVEVGPVLSASGSRVANEPAPRSPSAAPKIVEAPRAEPRRERVPEAPARAPVAPPVPPSATPVAPKATPKPQPERAPREEQPTPPARTPRAPAPPPEPKTNKAVPIGVAALVLVIGFGGAYFLTHRASEPSARAADPKTTPTTQMTKDAPKSATTRPLDRDFADAPDADLAALPDLATAEKKASPEGVAIAEALARFLAAPPEARDASARELVSKGLAALPFVVDAWKRLDLANANDRALGAALERDVVAPLANGASFGWKPDATPESASFDRKVIAQWHRVCTSASASESAWTAFVAGPAH